MTQSDLDLERWQAAQAMNRLCAQIAESEATKAMNGPKSQAVVDALQDVAKQIKGLLRQKP